jgi:DNA-binding phage protein
MKLEINKNNDPTTRYDDYWKPLNSLKLSNVHLVDLCFADINQNHKNDNNLKHTDICTEISQLDAFNIYRNNNDFRRVINTGMFRFIDNQFIINHKKYLTTDDYGRYRLTDYARNNLHECALRFIKKNGFYDINLIYPGFVAFSLDSSAKKNSFHFSFDGNESIIDNADALQKLQESFNNIFETHYSLNHTFAHSAAVLMKNKKWNSMIFKERTLLDDSMYSRILSNTRNPSFRTAIAICVGLGVDSLTAIKMLEGAGYTFSPSKEHQAYYYLFTALQGKSIDECNAFLEKVAITPLGNREKN